MSVVFVHVEFTMCTYVHVEMSVHVEFTMCTYVRVEMSVHVEFTMCTYVHVEMSVHVEFTMCTYVRVKMSVHTSSGQFVTWFSPCLTYRHCRSSLWTGTFPRSRGRYT